MIHLDTREQREVREGLLLRLGESEVSRHKLEAADIAIFDHDGHSLGIEHKRPLDWLASLGDKQANGERRIWNQIARMKEMYTHPLIVRTGSLSYSVVDGTLGTSRHSSGWRSTAARLLEWSVAQQVPLLTLDSIEEFLDLIVYLNKRAKSGCVIPGQGILSHAATPTSQPDAPRVPNLDDRADPGTDRNPAPADSDVLAIWRLPSGGPDVPHRRPRTRKPNLVLPPAGSIRPYTTP